jgi:hypothetical protein
MKVINIYNKARMEDGGYTIDCTDLLKLIEGNPVLTGDFNA